MKCNWWNEQGYDQNLISCYICPLLWWTINAGLSLLLYLSSKMVCFLLSFRNVYIAYITSIYACLSKKFDYIFFFFVLTFSWFWHYSHILYACHLVMLLKLLTATLLINFIRSINFCKVIYIWPVIYMDHFQRMHLCRPYCLKILNCRNINISTRQPSMDYINLKNNLNATNLTKAKHSQLLYFTKLKSN